MMAKPMVPQEYSYEGSRFAAFASAPTTKQMMRYTYLFVFGAMASIAVINMLLYLVASLTDAMGVIKIGSALVFFAFLFAAMPSYAAFQRRLNRPKLVLIDVREDGITVSIRPREVFAFDAVHVGDWVLEGYRGVNKGTALHFGSGRRRFILGGRDHRAETGTETEPVDAVDAWLWAGDFGAFLTMISRHTALDVRLPPPGRTIRCLLAPNPVRLYSSSVKLGSGAPRTGLAIDIDGDVVSMGNTTVTATAASHTRSVARMGVLTTAVLVVPVTDSAPLTITCPDWAGPPQATLFGRTKVDYRFAWRGEVPQTDEPEFVVADADWLVLVNKLGLADRLVDRAKDGATEPAAPDIPLARPRRRLWVFGVAIAALMLVAPVLMSVAGRIQGGHQNKTERLLADKERPYMLPFNGLRVPHGVAVDAKGSVYVIDGHTDEVLKLAPGHTSQTVLPFTGLDLCDNDIDASIDGIAVDGAGDVFITDSCHQRVLKLAAGSNTPIELPFNLLDTPHGIAADTAGTVYVVEYSHGRIWKLPAGASKPIELTKAGRNGATGSIAVDTAGDVYASCSRGRSRDSCLAVLAHGSDTWTTLPSVKDNSGDTLSTGEQDVAVDSAGNVYMIASRTVMKLAAGSTNWSPLPGTHQLIDPLGLAVDPSGVNVYVTDHTGSRARETIFGKWKVGDDDAYGFVLKLPTH